MGVRCSKRRQQLQDDEEWELIPPPRRIKGSRLQRAVAKVIVLGRLRKVWSRTGASLNVNKAILSNGAVRFLQKFFGRLGNFLRAQGTGKLFDHLRSVKGKQIYKNNVR